MVGNAKHKVLLVEDDADLRLGLEVLVGMEFEVMSCSDGDSALDAVRRNPPDVVVMDLGLPDCDGLELIERLHDLEEGSHVTTIIVTGRETEEIEARAIQSGASCVFKKPADSVALVDVIRRVVAEK